MLPDLWIHQKEALKTGKDRFCLFFDTGTGKTRTALEFYKMSAPEKVLIVAPLNVCRNWEIEIPKYCGKKKTFLVAGQTAQKKIRAINNFADCKEPAFLIINTDSMRVPTYTDILKRLKISFIVIDEAHEFKNPDSNRTQGLLKIVKVLSPKNLYLLTGTPTPQGEMDLYIYMFLMGFTDDAFFFWRKKFFTDVNNAKESDQYLSKLYKHLNGQGNLCFTSMPFKAWKDYLMKTIRASPNPLKIIWERITAEGKCKTDYIDWRMEMIDRLKSFPKFVLNKEAAPKIAEFLTANTMTANKNEVIDLPPFVRTSVYFEMESEQLAAYESMEKEFYCLLESGDTCTASNVLSQLIRLQQITAGFVGDDSFSMGRLKALEYAISLVGQSQFLIWSIFKRTYDQISKLLESLDIDYAIIHGDVSAENRANIIAMFQEGKIRCIVAHPRAGGVGVNMTAAAYSIHYTKDFNLVNDMQCEARNYRGGSEIHERITRIDVLAANSIDERVNDALIAKAEIQDFILNLRKNRIDHGR
jgi:SNF2 family DNA or RNA helicase